MPSVKYAISAYVADGTTTDYLITWDYLDEDHIAVYVDGTSNADPTASHTFVQLNSTTLRITDNLGNAIVSGSEIEIRRETPLTTRAITFADGSALLAADLNKNSDYLLYSMQEVLDTVDAAAQDGALAAQTATEGFRDQAEQHKIDAQTAQTASEAARDTAQTYLATVQSDATDADNHRIAAAASETAAATSEANAATSEANSASSASASAASAAASLASEQAAAASETAAAASEVASAASEAAAATSEANAATSEANAAASYDSFDDRYLGAKSVAPTVDNDGDALLVGALYWNDVSDAMYVWNGSAWDTLPTSIGIADSATSTQITITDTETSFTQPLDIDTINWRNSVNPDVLMWTTDNGIAISSGTASHTGTTNKTISDAGMLAIKRQSDAGTEDPYISFHGDNGNRVGYIQFRTDERRVNFGIDDTTTGRQEYAFDASGGALDLIGGLSSGITTMRVRPYSTSHNLTLSGSATYSYYQFQTGAYWNDTTDTINYYTGESIIYARSATNGNIAGSDSYTYICARNVADGSDAFNCTVDSNTKIELDSNGNCYNDGVWSTSAADYAEMFEWSDGNPDGEDRVGHTVALVGNKVRKAVAGDNPANIIGVVSGAPAVLGDNDLKKWSKWAAVDDWNRPILEPVDVVKWKDETGAETRYTVDRLTDDITVPEDAVYETVYQTAYNPEWDKTKEYIPRQQRKEWDAIGLMGKLRIHAGQPVGDRWIKMRDIKLDDQGNPLIEEWLVR